MYALQIILLWVAFIFCSLIKAGVPETISVMDKILAQGDRKIAILVIDMQEKYTDNLYPDELSRKLPNQISLLEHYAGNDKVLFINVNYLDRGKTLPELLHAIRRKQVFKTIVKKDLDAFDKVKIYDKEDLAGEIGHLSVYLKENKVTDIVPIGCFSTSCIAGTAKGASKNGLHVVVDHDLNMSFNKSFSYRRTMGDKKHRKVEDKIWKKVVEEYPNIQIVEPQEKVLPCQ